MGTLYSSLLLLSPMPQAPQALASPDRYPRFCKAPSKIDSMDCHVPIALWLPLISFQANKGSCPFPTPHSAANAFEPITPCLNFSFSLPEMKRAILCAL